MYLYIMERTQIYLTKAQAAALDREARRTGTTRSHLIREAIDERFVKAAARETLRATIGSSFGAWRGRRETGAEYVDRIRVSDRLVERPAAEREQPDDVSSGHGV